MIAPAKSVMNHRLLASEIQFPDGPKAGMEYDPADDPIHDAVVHTMDNTNFTRHVWVGAVQTGKSLLLLLLMLRVITQLRQSLVYSQPTLTKILEAWEGKMKPIIESSSFATWLPRGGIGSKGGHGAVIVARDPRNNSRAGSFYFLSGGGKSEAAQAGTTAMWIFNDEVDSYKTRHRIELIAKRADSFGKHARRIYTSTVKSDESSIILGMYEESTMSRLYFKCPHCGTWGPLEWENITYEKDDEISAGQSVRYIAPCCAVRWSEEDRRAAHRNWRIVHKGQEVDENGTVIGDIPRVMTFGLLWTGLDSSIRPMSVMAIEHLRATRALENGDHGPMRSFYRDQLCRMYKGEIEELEIGGEMTWQKLHLRSQREKWGPYRSITDRDSADPDRYLYSRKVCEPPSEATHSVVSIDVQANRVYWILRSFNLDKTSWITAYGYEYSRIDHDNHNEQELHAVLDRVALAIPAYCGTTNLCLGAVDVGDNTDVLLRWIRAKVGIWRAMRGHMNNMKADAADVEGLVYVREDIFLMHADNARDMFHATFRRPLDAPGTTHIASGLGAQESTLFKHFVSEQTTLDPKSKKRITKRGSGRNDFLDCAKMTEVLIYGFIQDFRANEGPRTAQPIRSEAPQPEPEDGSDGPVRVGSALATRSANRATYGGINRIQRRSSRFMPRF
jgi:phage terminase large subunit GpA-like protein